MILRLQRFNILSDVNPTPDTITCVDFCELLIILLSYVLSLSFVYLEIFSEPSH